jgi:hypothetical protein
MIPGFIYPRGSPSTGKDIEMANTHHASADLGEEVMPPRNTQAIRGSEQPLYSGQHRQRLRLAAPAYEGVGIGIADPDENRAHLARAHYREIAWHGMARLPQAGIRPGFSIWLLGDAEPAMVKVLDDALDAEINGRRGACSRPPRTLSRAATQRSVQGACGLRGRCATPVRERRRIRGCAPPSACSRPDISGRSSLSAKPRRPIRDAWAG